DVWRAEEVAKQIFECGLRVAEGGVQKGEERGGEGEKGRRGEGEKGRRGEGEKGRREEEELLGASEGSQRLCGENDLDLTSATFPIDASNSSNPQSAVRNPQSRDPQSAVRNPQSRDQQSAIRNPRSIKVRSVSENLTRELELEEYLVGVLAAESSVENEIEALKAQAVVSRAFALKNLGRHAREGYDFCSTTHCQRFVFLKTKSALNAAARRAVEETAGLMLSDPSSGAGGIID